MTWLHSPEINPLDYEGFVYLITNNVTGKAYVGRKYIYRFSKGKIVGESDWRTYWGSSKEVSADIASIGVENFTREILHFCRTRGETNLLEVEEQFKREVLRARLPNGERAFYNNSIMGRYFSRTADSYATGNKRSISVERVQYELNPSSCTVCSKPLSFHRRNGQFCSVTCTNSRRSIINLESGDKRSATRLMKTVSKLNLTSVEELVSLIVELRSTGLTQHEIASRLGISKRAVQRFLKRATP